MATIQDLVETIWENWRKIVNGELGIENTTVELHDGIRATVRRQFRLIRVLVKPPSEGSFEIIVTDQTDMGGNPNSESLSIPLTKHRRFWNRIAAKTRKRAAATDSDKDSRPSEWNLYRRDSIVLGKTSKQEELSFFVAVCFLRWGLCSSVHLDLYTEIMQYLRRFKIPDIRTVSEEYTSVESFRSAVAEYVIYHLREPQHPHDINKYLKMVIAGLTHQAKGPTRRNVAWLDDDGSRGLAVENAAEYLHLTKQHLYAEIRRGTIKAKRVAGHWFIPEMELDRLEKDQEKKRMDTDKRQAAIEYLISEFGLKSETARKAVQRMKNYGDDGESFRDAFDRYVSGKQAKEASAGNRDPSYSAG